MLYRRFGRTELQIPVFSCGGMRYQYKWEDLTLQDIPQDNQDNLEATIRRSVDLGDFPLFITIFVDMLNGVIQL